MTATASAAQRAASDPRVSAFVAAHAGTGKTKLLIDRLLRLMLAGADPGRILCLTYTKAAAAEMAIRLQRRLGAWVTLSDARLNADLAELDVAGSAASRQKARALFAQVLDLPGGMRIGTIHAFCQSLLKRFPLEARISPHFQLVDGPDKRAEMDRARETALPVAEPAGLAELAGLVSAEGFSSLVAALEGKRDRLAPALALPGPALRAAMRRAAGVAHRDEAAVLAAAVSWADEEPLRAVVTLSARHGSDTVRARAERILEWLSLPADLRAEHWSQWVDEFLTAERKPRGLSVFANKRLSDQYSMIIPACAAEQARIEAVEDARRAIRLAEASAALLRVAAPILERYAEAKGRRALLDYDDLIGRSFGLLDNPEFGAAWVLYKLDGGLDHLLLDEVQDTAPEQWLIADRLTGDFFVGEGAREGAGLARTVFAVGDRKQSIYSFQGADPGEFDRWGQIFEKRARQAGCGWHGGVLEVSFRSTAPVLGLVDAIFNHAPFAEGVAGEGEILHHVAQRASHAGRVELWPVTPRPEVAAQPPWTVPQRNQTRNSAPQRLVDHLAGWIAGQVGGGVMLESAGRPLHAGDVLVLVRRRGDFGRALMRALKARGVAVAGLDRMMLTEQPAVQDLMALCDALLLPQDDLTLAEMLVSPLGGLSDESLMALAAPRAGSLWEELRRRGAEREDWRRARDFFMLLLGRADYTQPYALLSEALGPLGGRARLFARLGPEAAEPVDELLAAALLYATHHPPSLQGFLHWLRLSASEVTREAEAAGDAVRIMTVHGAKGLEAPLVILPDTTGLPPDEHRLHWTMDPGSGTALPLWQPNKELRCRAVEDLKARNAAARMGEYRRLLYVALTRARDRLVVCGWELHRPQAGSWYEMVESGMAALGAQPEEFGPWPGVALVLATPQAAAPSAPEKARAVTEQGLPEWAGRPPAWQPDSLPPEPTLPRPLAPSRPDGAALGPVPPARSPLARAAAGGFGRGVAMHALLQHLPELQAGDRAAAARAYATRCGVDEPDSLASQALRVLAHQEAQPLFGPGSRAEQPISGLVGEQIVSGQVDRLAVLPDRVLIGDFKTNRAPPATVEDVPVLYLRQMAAYRAVLRLIYPGREVSCLLIWTEGPAVMSLPASLLDKHAPGYKAALA